MFAYSFDEEDYRLGGETREETIAEALSEADDEQRFWIGECETPSSPELFWHAEDWLEHVGEQDSYCAEYAEGWDRSTKEQRSELESEVRAVMLSWLQRHRLLPSFYSVHKIEEHRIENDVAERVR